MPNPFEKELGIPLPKCCSLGSCCKGASPSTPYHKLLKRAGDGDDFARGFFSIMVPYPNHAEAETVVPGVVERTLKAAQKLEEFKTPEDIVFYQCRYQTTDNKCGIWEDRPQFCRDYPDTPFVVMAPGCAFEPWAKACKEKYFALKDEVAQLKTLKAELDTLRRSQSAYRPADTKIDAPFLESHNADDLESGLSLVLSLTDLYISTPLSSIRFIR